MRKYEFTGEVKMWLGRTLHRIKAVVAFGDVKVGDIGGWIENEENLSHDGEAWVYGEARVYGEAWVYGKACVYDEAWVYGEAWVCDNKCWLGIACIGSRNDFTTFFRTKESKIFVSCGCFKGDIDQFAKKVKKTHGDNEHAKAYMLAIELAKLRIQGEQEHREEVDFDYNAED